MEMLIAIVVLLGPVFLATILIPPERRTYNGRKYDERSTCSNENSDAGNGDVDDRFTTSSSSSFNNIDGTPMIGDSGIDVSGHVYGTSYGHED